MEFEDRIYISLPSVLRWLAGILIACSVIAYALFQARHLIEGPIITLTKEPPATTTAPIVELAGTSANIVAISLNGRDIFTTDEGIWHETVPLQKGYTILTIEGVDRYGNRARIERTIIRETHESDYP